ncbi:TlpA family protein disulfide reductase [bacterium]|nr:TlpA family protein disulfide reductase [bacterium]
MSARVKARLPVVAAILSLLALSGGAVSAEGVKPSPPPAVDGGGTRFAEPGTIAPDFTIFDVRGRPFRLSEEVSRRPVLLLFWSIFCDPCRAGMAILRRAEDRHADRDLAVVAVAVDGGVLRSTIGGYARQEGYAFTVLVDELDSAGRWKVADAYGVSATPTLLLLEKGGKVLLRKEGRIREEEIEKTVSALPKR